MDIWWSIDHNILINSTFHCLPDDRISEKVLRFTVLRFLINLCTRLDDGLHSFIEPGSRKKLIVFVIILRVIVWKATHNPGNTCKGLDMSHPDINEIAMSNPQNLIRLTSVPLEPSRDFVPYPLQFR